MKNMKKTILGCISLSLLIAFTACKEEAKKEKTKKEQGRPLHKVSAQETGQISDSMKGTYLFADSIIYDVIIKNTEPVNQWKKECLKGLNKKVFLNKLFKNIYNSTFKVYDFSSNTRLSVEEVKAIETDEEYKRENIGKMQFMEDWYYDFSTGTMYKKIHSVILGYETYNPSGEVKGYKPLFKIIME